MDLLLEKLASFATGTGGFIVAFGLAVFIHELGHFLAAKLFKVPVERFVIGFDRDAMPFMPRCIWEKKIGETTYGISLVPLGGYVKMVGTVHPDIEKYLDGDQKKDEGGGTKAKESGTADAAASSSEAASDVKMPAKETLAGQAMQDMQALYRKPFWQKTIIYGAGVTMNLVLAMAIIAFMGIRGEMVDAPRPAVVGWLAPDSALAVQDVRQGDGVVAVDGNPVQTNDDYEKALYEPIPSDMPLGFLYALASVPDDYVRNVTITFERDGQRFDRSFSFDMEEPAKGEEPESRKTLKALANLTSMPAIVGYAIRNKPAADAGLEVGDVIVSIDGEPVDDWMEMLDIVSRNAGNALDVAVDRGGDRREFSITPTKSTTEPVVGQIGIMPGMANPIRKDIPLAVALAKSPGEVVNKTILYALNLKKVFGRLFTGQFRQVREDLGGPVAIAQMAGYHANLGLDRFLQFMLMLNIALAVMNILPLPILDGGHIVLAMWEGVFGKPMSPKILVPVLNGAVYALIGFFVLITLSDVLKIFWK